jgi:citrate lyase subunit beta/citryl-CoA lyase
MNAGGVRLRSLLFVPAPRADTLFVKALASGADVVVLDLEDSVMAEDKTAARAKVSVTAHAPRTVPLMIRINAVRSPYFADDLKAASESDIDGVMIPKAESREEVALVVDELAKRRRTDRLIVPLIETARGVVDALAIADTPGVSALAFGGEDYAVSLGLSRTRSGSEIAFPRNSIVLAAAAAQVSAIDTPQMAVDDTTLLRLDAKAGLRMGFAGKLAIHPNQIRTINHVFTPTETEVEAAQAIIHSYFAAAGRGTGGAFVLDGRLVDRPVVRRARATLVRADAIGSGPLERLDNLLAERPEAGHG